MKLATGKRVRCGAAGPNFNRIGVITTGKYGWMMPEKVYIRWDDDLLSSGYWLDSEVVECLQEVDS
jgi:hypothetical protein